MVPFHSGNCRRSIVLPAAGEAGRGRAEEIVRRIGAGGDREECEEGCEAGRSASGGDSHDRERGDEWGSRETTDTMRPRAGRCNSTRRRHPARPWQLRRRAPPPAAARRMPSSPPPAPRRRLRVHPHDEIPPEGEREPLAGRLGDGPGLTSRRRGLGLVVDFSTKFYGRGRLVVGDLEPGGGGLDGFGGGLGARDPGGPGLHRLPCAIELGGHGCEGAGRTLRPGPGPDRHPRRLERRPGGRGLAPVVIGDHASPAARKSSKTLRACSSGSRR
jgi:hypothetical protein